MIAHAAPGTVPVLLADVPAGSLIQVVNYSGVTAFLNTRPCFEPEDGFAISDCQPPVSLNDFGGPLYMLGGEGRATGEVWALS